MNQLQEELINCPYCGEALEVLIDLSDAGAEYIEDCQVCCRPINFHLRTAFDGTAELFVRAENEI